MYKPLILAACLLLASCGPATRSEDTRAAINTADATALLWRAISMERDCATDTECELLHEAKELILCAHEEPQEACSADFLREADDALDRLEEILLTETETP